LSFVDFCESVGRSHCLIFSERGGQSLREVSDKLPNVAQLSVCVGPEGGWSERELEKAEANNFIAVCLGARILRTETAAIAAVILAQHLFGDLR
jgi:16S rRNA (uracil1498-N3)-methyltransferase